MSKLFNKYLSLKNSDNTKLYLFKSGIFYIFLDEDAKKISSILNLKLTNLNDKILKCGFPCSNISKYMEKLKSLDINFQIVDENLNSVTYEKKYIDNVEISNIIDSIKKLDMNKLSPIQAFSILSKFKETLHGLEN